MRTQCEGNHPPAGKKEGPPQKPSLRNSDKGFLGFSTIRNGSLPNVEFRKTANSFQFVKIYRSVYIKADFLISLEIAIRCSFSNLDIEKVSSFCFCKENNQIHIFLSKRPKFYNRGPNTKCFKLSGP